ncbi:unnamed protein product [Chondrus crispus]|uniref:Glutathione peroxidase n=1 Tax=Chondrus crispus TaxID=2769 RepID=R7QCZ5_CHOCR|nr:unnamed protein product [Chondrus crispus]CDF35643.1 unnamed protein product [Chondrus crispus]|eukprot:XP_005715462.1 unnamed protein product [Chondrus crispus]
MSERAVSKVKSVFAFGAFFYAPSFLSLRVGLPESGCVRRSTAKRQSASRRPPAPSPRFHASVTRRTFLAATLSLPAVLLPELVTAKTSVKSAYSIVTSKDGAPLALDKFSGKVTLFVNVATYCALTPQYEGLVSLFEKFQARGFEIIASPCDQFGHQEPGSNDEICKFAKEKFGARFLLLDKLNVNDGPGGVAPLYQFLRDTSPENPGQRVGWNFEKFLVGSDGRVLRRYKPGVLPEQIDEDIGWALQHLGQDLPPKKKPSLGVT